MRRPQEDIVAIALAVLVSLPGCGGGSHDDASSKLEAGWCGDPYPKQSPSAYILPYSVGSSFLVGQGNCTGADDSHAAGTTDAFAYDIDMPIGTRVIAARAGRVHSIEERYGDGSRMPGQENFVEVRHEDGSVGLYFHLTRDGALVEVGDIVRQGDTIARSGDSGDSTEPHLHFQVNGAENEGSVPVVFRNTRAHPYGLVEGEIYQAEPF